MTRKEIRENVQSNLEDSGAVYWTAETINEKIQQGYSRFAYLTGYITKARYYPLIPQPYWEVKNHIGDFLYLNGIYDDVRNRWLTPVDLRYIRNLRDDWELWTGSPEYVTPLDLKRLAICPHPATSGGACVIHYCASANTLIDSTSPIIPPVCKSILEFYATAKLLAELKEFSKAKIYWSRWKQGIADTIAYVSANAKADKMNVMLPYLQMPLYGKGGSMAAFIDDEIPTGTIDGVNATFTLSASPSPADSLQLYKNGQLLFEGVGYNLTGNSIVYETDYIPSTGDIHRAWYRMS